MTGSVYSAISPADSIPASHPNTAKERENSPTLASSLIPAIAKTLKYKAPRNRPAVNKRTHTMTKLFEKRYHESINKQNIAAVPTEASAHVCFVNVTRLGLIKDTTILYDRRIALPVVMALL